MMKLNWREPRANNSFGYKILELQTGLYSKKAFDLLEKILQSNETNDLLNKPYNYGGLVKIVTLQSTLVSTEDQGKPTMPIYVMPNENGEAVIFFKSWQYSDPEMPSLGVVKVYLKRFLDEYFNKHFTFSEDDDKEERNLLTILHLYFDSGIPPVNPSTFEEIIGTPFNAFESKMAENLIDDYFSALLRFLLNTWTPENFGNASEWNKEQTNAYNELKGMLK